MKKSFKGIIAGVVTAVVGIVGSCPVLAQSNPTTGQASPLYVILPLVLAGVLIALAIILPLFLKSKKDSPSEESAETPSKEE